MSKISIYGDSIMKGIVVEEGIKYRPTMGKYIKEIEQDYHLTIKNKARFGMTAPQGFEMLKKDMSAGENADYALIAFGGNDCNFIWQEVSENPEATHTPATVLDKFKETYHGIIKTLSKNSVKPVLMTLPPIDSQKYLDFLARIGNNASNLLKWLGDCNMIYRFHELYSDAVAKIALQTDSLLVDVRSRFLDNHRFSDLISIDGIHLAPEGYRLLVGTLQDFIAEQQSIKNAVLA